jgi:urease accessory protein UreF
MSVRPSETCAVPPPPDRSRAPEEAELPPGGLSALLRQVGSPEAFSDGLAAQWTPDATRPCNGLRDFLEAYQTDLLVPVEMPAIARARSLAALCHSRELIALDRELGAMPVFPAFASASRRIGRAQLERLRPLRDEHTVQRYLAAVEAGRAAGWHTVVYGITLAVYSRPLRQGLLIYAQETLSGLALAAGSRAGFAGPDFLEILRTLLPRLPGAIERTLAECGEGGLIL